VDCVRNRASVALKADTTFAASAMQNLLPKACMQALRKEVPLPLELQR